MIQLINWDCYIELERLIEQNVKIDLIIADPPYEISVTNKWGSINNIKWFNKSLKEINKKQIDKWYDYIKFFELVKQLQNKINMYIRCNKKWLPIYINYFSQNKNILIDILIRHKVNAIPSYFNKYLTDCEYCIYIKEKGAYCKPKSYEDAKTIYIDKINHIDKKRYKHPTIKPLPFITKLVKNSCPPWWIVLDPFMWSWTTGVACKLTNRNFIGIELDEDYFEIAKKRINETTQWLLS